MLSRLVFRERRLRLRVRGLGPRLRRRGADDLLRVPAGGVRQAHLAKRGCVRGVPHAWGHPSACAGTNTIASTNARANARTNARANAYPSTNAGTNAGTNASTNASTNARANACSACARHQRGSSGGQRELHRDGLGGHLFFAGDSTRGVAGDTLPCFLLQR